MAGPPSPRLDDNDCLRLPAASSPRIRGAEKKEATGLRLSQPCPPYVTPSSISSFGRRLNGARIAENKSLKNMAQTHSAKVVLGPVLINVGSRTQGGSLPLEARSAACG